MKTKKTQIAYDPNLIWTCSVDLREKKSKLREVKIEREKLGSGTVPFNAKPNPDRHTEPNLN
jgi:hypothetical protein